MPVTLVVEDGTVVLNANGYCTVDFANTYNDEHPHGDTWITYGTADKQRGIIMATRLMDEQIKWYGSPTYNLASSVSSSNATAKVQYLRFPRSGIADQDGYSLDHHTIPTFLKNATAELARYLAAKDRTAEPDTQGFGTVKLGSLTVGIDKYDNPPILPRSVRAIIQPYGTVRGGNVAVVRRT